MPKYQTPLEIQLKVPFLPVNSTQLDFIFLKLQKEMKYIQEITFCHGQKRGILSDLKTEEDGTGSLVELLHLV